MMSLRSDSDKLSAVKNVRTVGLRRIYGDVCIRTAGLRRIYVFSGEKMG